MLDPEKEKDDVSVAIKRLSDILGSRGIVRERVSM